MQIKNMKVRGLRAAVIRADDRNADLIERIVRIGPVVDHPYNRGMTPTPGSTVRKTRGCAWRHCERAVIEPQSQSPAACCTPHLVRIADRNLAPHPWTEPRHRSASDPGDGVSTSTSTSSRLSVNGDPSITSLMSSPSNAGTSAANCAWMTTSPW